jgi:penicillin-binding protein 1A
MLKSIKMVTTAVVSVVGGLIGRTFGFLVMTGLFAGLLVGIYVLSLMDDLPEIDRVNEIELNVPLRIFTSDGLLIGEYGNERRIPILIQDTPSILLDAIIAAEDDNFYSHSGVDYWAIMRAVVSNLKSGGRGQGASTITMQVARNFFLSNEKTYERKLKEVLVAFKLEKTLSKAQILELYINKIFLGNRSYGFAAAAQTYYGRPLNELNLPQLTMLAGLPKAPSAYNPIRNDKRAKQRRNYVLGRMHTLNLIDDLSHQVAKKAPITASLHLAELDMQAPYVSELARQYMVDHYGKEDTYAKGYNVTLTVNSVYQLSARKALRQGLLDYDSRHGYRGPAANVALESLELEDDELSKATQILRDYDSSSELKVALVGQVDERSAMVTLENDESIKLEWEGISWAQPYSTPDSMGIKPEKATSMLAVGDVIYVIPQQDQSWRLSQMPEIAGAMVTLDTRSGAILSMVGGFDYYLSKFNRAAMARRQLGSNIKPFIYAAALEQGLTPASMVSGAPIVVENAEEGIWRPENYSKKFFGPTRLRKALTLSLNLVSVRLLRAIGIDYTTEFLRGFGFEASTLPDNLSLALGSASVTPLQVASAYATLSNRGMKTRPYLIQSISDRDGNYISKIESSCDICTVLDEDKRPFSNLSEADLATPSMSPEGNFLITDMMKSVITSGTGRKALVLGRTDLSGKTGTTNNYRDAWFSGFNPDVTTSVWVGFDQPSYLGRRESGAGAALPVWVNHMREVLKDFPESAVTAPAGITTAFISKDDGKLADSQNPDGFWEYFKIGTEPRRSGEAVVRQGEVPVKSVSVETDTDTEAEDLF